MKASRGLTRVPGPMILSQIAACTGRMVWDLGSSIRLALKGRGWVGAVVVVPGLISLVVVGMVLNPRGPREK